MNSTAWIGLIGALGGVLITGTIGLLTATLNHRWQAATAQHDREFRTTDRLYDLRREAYVRYLQAAQAMGDGHKAMTQTRSTEQSYAAFARTVWADFDDVRREYDTSMRNAQLLASKGVRRAVKQYDSWLQDACRRKMDTGERFGDWGGREDDLIEAMRAEQAALPGAS